MTGEASGEAEIHGVEEGRGTDSFIPTELAKPQRHSVVMALKSEDLSSGFRHGKVMAFINDRMSRHAKGPEFYLENVSLSWEKVEDKQGSFNSPSGVLGGIFSVMILGECCTTRSGAGCAGDSTAFSSKHKAPLLSRTSARSMGYSLSLLTQIASMTEG